MGFGNLKYRTKEANETLGVEGMPVVDNMIPNEKSFIYLRTWKKKIRILTQSKGSKKL